VCVKHRTNARRKLGHTEKDGGRGSHSTDQVRPQLDIPARAEARPWHAQWHRQHLRPRLLIAVRPAVARLEANEAICADDVPQHRAVLTHETFVPDDLAPWRWGRRQTAATVALWRTSLLKPRYVFEFSLCLSRACLGTMVICIQNVDHKTVFAPRRD
jgi:hypothetical protein